MFLILYSEHWQGFVSAFDTSHITLSQRLQATWVLIHHLLTAVGVFLPQALLISPSFSIEHRVVIDFISLNVPLKILNHIFDELAL